MPTAPPAYPVVVTRNRPDRLEDPDQFLADDFEDEDIRETVDKLAPICDGFRRHSFAWHYDVGKVVRSAYEAIEKQRVNMYGARFFNRLAHDLNRPDVDGNLLSRCFRIVRQYTEAEYLSYVQRPEVSPTHLLILAGIGTPEDREELLQSVIDNKLTTQQLHTAIKEKYGMRHKGKPGRPLKVPADVKAGLTHLTTQTEKYLKFGDTVWFGDDFDIIHKTHVMPADRLTDEFRAMLATAKEQNETLATLASDRVNALRDALAEVDRRRAAQAALEAKQVGLDVEHEEVSAGGNTAA